MENEQTFKELIEKAYKLGFEYEEFYRGCSQAALGAIYDTLNRIFQRHFSEKVLIIDRLRSIFAHICSH